MTDTSFQYTLRIRPAATAVPALREVFPSVEGVRVRSRLFPTLEDAVDSCNRLVKDLAEALNREAGGEPFYLASEINPDIRREGEADVGADPKEDAPRPGDEGGEDEDDDGPVIGTRPADDYDWEINEVARLWLIDSRDDRVPAAGAKLFETYGSDA